MKRRWVLVALLLSVGVAYALGRVNAPPGDPLPVMPPRTIVVERVKHIEVPIEIRVEVPGPVRIVEQVRWKTKTETVEVPVIQEVVRIVTRAAELGTLYSAIEIDADKFEGLVGDRLEYGWRGNARCQIRADPADHWTQIHDQPFDLSSSTAVTTERPDDTRGRWTADIRLGVVSSPGLDLSASFHRQSRWGWYAGLQYDIDPQTFDALEFSEDFAQSVTFQSDRARVYGGIEFRIGRR